MAGRPKENLYEKYEINKKAEQIKAWCRNGATDIIIAKKLHIGKTTLHRLKTLFPEFKELLKTGKEDADNLVENALFKRAVGYEYEETTQEIRIGKDGEAQPAVIKKTKKFIPPDTTAQIFWMKNRRPEQWRDKQVMEHEVDNPFIQALMEAGKQGIHDTDTGEKENSSK